jgi:hypothetical protein
MDSIMNKCALFLQSAYLASAMYVLWIFLHYISAHLYCYYCAPNTFIGFISSPFLVASPHCVGLRWTINNGATVMNAMWALLGGWLCSKLLISRPVANVIE